MNSQEGENCPVCGSGTMHYPPVENCSCHINPPCFDCVDNLLTCNSCGWTTKDPAAVVMGFAPYVFDKPPDCDTCKVPIKVLHVGHDWVALCVNLDCQSKIGCQYGKTSNEALLKYHEKAYGVFLS